MAVTDETIRLANGARLQVNSLVDAQTRDLVRSWANSWDTLSVEWNRAMMDVASRHDKWPSQTVLRKNRRILSALSATQEALLKLQDAGTVRIVGDVRAVADLAGDATEQIMRSQLPGDLQTRIGFNRPDPKAMEAMVRRTMQRVTKLAETVGTRSYAMMLSELNRGTALGVNPLQVASRMNARLENRFHNSLHRMNIISRTEMLDANRAATNASMKANDDILQGWQWIAELDDKTCPACWSMHGEIFSLDTVGPEDHQQGRCSSIPATKTWRQLGFDIDEPPSVLPDAQEVFNGLPEQSKLEIMGRDRLSALNSGTASWSDLSQYKTNPDWRGSYTATPVSALI